MKTLILSSVILAVTASASLAGTPLVDLRENKQMHRIYKGVVNGNLTFRETNALLIGQAKVHRAERRFKSDGNVSPGERLQLFMMQSIQSQRIYNKKHN